jgi:cation transport regulator ChaB
MSAPSPLTLNRTRFDASFVGKETDAKNRATIQQKLAEYIGVSSDGAKWLIRLYDDFVVLRDKLNLSREDQSKIDAYKTAWNSILSTGTVDIGMANQLATISVELLPILQKALQAANAPIDHADKVRLLSACTKSLCAILVAMGTQNSQLATHTSIPIAYLRKLQDELGGRLAAAKLAQHEINAKLSSMDDARKALKNGGKAIGFHVNPQTGRVTFVELEIQNSILGYGGQPAPKVGDDQKARWMVCAAFAQVHKGNPAIPPVLVNLRVPFETYDDLPELIKNVEGVNALQVHQQQPFLDAINSKWHEWEDAYKTAHPGDAADEKGVLAREIIEQGIVKAEIAKMVTAAAAVPKPQPEPPPT